MGSSCLLRLSACETLRVGRDSRSRDQPPRARAGRIRDRRHSHIARFLSSGCSQRRVPARSVRYGIYRSLLKRWNECPSFDRRRGRKASRPCSHRSHPARSRARHKARNRACARIRKPLEIIRATGWAKMRYEAEIDGRQVSVELDERDGRISAKIGERDYDLEIARPEESVYLIFDQDHIYETRVWNEGTSALRVQLRDRIFTVNIIDRNHMRATADHSSDGRQQLTAPMPGKVVRVLLEP